MFIIENPEGVATPPFRGLVTENDSGGRELKASFQIIWRALSNISKLFRFFALTCTSVAFLEEAHFPKVLYNQIMKPDFNEKWILDAFYSERRS